MSKADTGLGKCNQELGKATNSQTVRKTNPSNPSSGEAKRTVSDRTFFQI
jgi:hypothetical protein